MIRSGLIAFSVVLLASTAVLSAETGETKNQEGGLHARLLGHWSYLSGKRAGQTVGQDRLAGTVTFRKQELTLPAGPTGEFLIAYSIDTSKTPATIDLSIKDGPVKEGKSVGIMKIDGDQLTLCYVPEGKPRPDKFESTEENGAHLFVLKRKPALDVAKLPGEWTYVSGERAGSKADSSRLQGTVTFTQDTVTLPAGPDAKFVMAYTIDASKTPATIDLEIKDGPVQEGKVQGVIKMDGDKLSICYHPEGSKRPSAFTSTEEDGNFVFVLQRKK